MKETYSAPEFKLILLKAENILAISDEKDPGEEDIW